MLGIRFIKSQPTVHLMQFKKGRVVREGAGQSFFYYAPTSTVVAVPIASADHSFMLSLSTSDFQEVTVQGQVTYRVASPTLTANLMDFSLAPSGKGYASEDPQRLGDRVGMQAEVVIQQKVQAMPLKAALLAAAQIAVHTEERLRGNAELATLGLEVLGVSIVAVKPTPDIARALEAEAREANLKAADDAIYMRRMSAVEKERAIRQNELDTEVAVQQKQREIEETKMESRSALARKNNALRDEQMASDILLEEKRKEFVAGQAANSKTLAEAEAHRMEAVMKALQAADPKIVQALASVGMSPSQLIAQAFDGLASNADKIGQLNVSSELLQSLVASSGAGSSPPARGGRHGQ